MTAGNAFDATLEEAGPAGYAPAASRTGWSEVMELMTRPQPVTMRERRLAPALALGAAGIYMLFVAGLWVGYAIKIA